MTKLSNGLEDSFWVLADASGPSCVRNHQFLCASTATLTGRGACARGVRRAVQCFTKSSDKRLSIDFAALRQMVWLTLDGGLREKIGSDQPDMVRWIDTSCMVADCLTKRMRSDRLSGCLRSCWLDLIPTDESVLCKMNKQKGRTNPDGSAGDLGRNDHFDQWRSYMKELPAE